MKGKKFTALVLNFRKPKNMRLKEGEVAVHVRWLDAPPKLSSGVVNEEMSLFLEPGRRSTPARCWRPPR